MSTHTGTHLDAPFHFEESGSDIADSPAAALRRPRSCGSRWTARNASHGRSSGMNWDGVERVLLKTRSSNSARGSVRPRSLLTLSEDGAEFLARRALLLVGIDTPFGRRVRQHHAVAPDKSSPGSLRVAILEGTRLADVPDGEYGTWSACRSSLPVWKALRSGRSSCDKRLQVLP